MKCECPKCNHIFFLNPVRQKILKLLEFPLNVTELKEKTRCDSFGTIAYHLKKLLNERKIIKEKHGKNTYYFLKENQGIQIVVD